MIVNNESNGLIGLEVGERHLNVWFFKLFWFSKWIKRENTWILKKFKYVQSCSFPQCAGAIWESNNDPIFAVSSVSKESYILPPL